MSDKGTVRSGKPTDSVASRQSPPPEEQNPKQGQEAPASGKLGKDKEQFEKSAGEGRKESEKTLEELSSNPDRKARV